MNYKNIELLNMDAEDNIRCERHEFTQKNIHWHTYYELELVISGKGVHTINGVNYPFQAGDVFLLRPSDFHEFDLAEEGTNYLIEIPPTHLPNEITNVLLLANGNLIVHLDEEKFDIFKTMFLLIERHYLEDGAVNSLITEYLLCSLMLLFIEQIDNNTLNTMTNAPHRLSEMIFYIQHNFCENITLESLSSKFYISREYLCTLFKESTGTNITAYIRKLRLSYAAKLARTTNLKSIEISEACGFNSIATFLRNFKDEYGVSPLQMREDSKKTVPLNHHKADPQKENI